MSHSRLILIGLCAVGMVLLVWLFLLEEPQRIPGTGSIPHVPAATEERVDSRNPATLAELREAAPLEGPRERLAPPPAPSSAFSRRQELERSGYDAAGESVDAALQTLGGITSRVDKIAYMRGMFMRLGEGGSMDAVRALKQLRDGSDREAALRALVEGAHPEPPRGEDEYLEAFHGNNGGLILRLADRPELAAALAREMIGKPALGKILGRIVQSEVAQDPLRAMSYGDGLQGQARADFLADFARGWALADGPAAWAWALQEPDAALRESKQQSVIRGLSYEDPLAASQRLAQLPPGPGRDQTLQDVGRAWAGKDTQAALRWAGALPNPQEREAALSSINDVTPSGIGAALTSGPDGYPVISEVLAGGAASTMPQLSPGSRIVSVRDASGKTIDLQGKDLGAAVSLLRGAPGTPVTMEIIPAGGTPADRRVVVLTRKQRMLKN